MPCILRTKVRSLSPRSLSFSIRENLRETDLPRLKFVPPIGLFSTDVVCLKDRAKEKGRRSYEQKLSKKHDAFKWPVAYCRGFSFIASLLKSDSVFRGFFHSWTALRIPDFPSTVLSKCQRATSRRFFSEGNGNQAGGERSFRLTISRTYDYPFARSLFLLVFAYTGCLSAGCVVDVKTSNS